MLVDGFVFSSNWDLVDGFWNNIKKKEKNIKICKGYTEKDHWDGLAVSLENKDWTSEKCERERDG